MKGNSKSTGGGQGNIGNMLISVLLSIFIVLLGFGASLVFLLRYMTSKEVIDNAIKKLDISEAKLRFIDEGDKTIAELLQSNIDPELRQFLTKDRLEKLLGEKFVRNFVSGKANDYVEDLLKNTGEGIIEVDELEKLLEKNKDTISEDTSFYWETGEIHQLVKQFEGSLDQTDLALYRDENPQIFMWIRIFGSYGMAVFFLVLAALLLVLIIALQNKKLNALVYMGVTLILVGISNFAVGGMAGSQVSSLNRTIGLGRSFWKALLDPVKSRGMSQGIAFVAVGAVFCLVYILLRVSIGSKKK